MAEHAPRYKYDCDRCKFNWNCGILCDCVLKGAQDPPLERARKVAAVQGRWRQRRLIADKLEQTTAFLNSAAKELGVLAGLPDALQRRTRDPIASLSHLADDIRDYKEP